MAYETGTATDHVDLYEKLIAFLTTNEELVYQGQQWTVAWALETDPAEGVVLQGPGLAGTDEVLVGLKLVANVPDDAAEIQLRGMTGVNPTATGYEDHVNGMPNSARMLLRTSSMDYWFVANGRRFMVMVRVSTVYEFAYAGFFLPYSTPSQYPYPLFVGACAHGGGGANAIVANWRDLSEGHANFMWGIYNSTGLAGHDTPAWMLSPAGDWLRVGYSATQALIGPQGFGTGYNIASAVGLNNYGYNSIQNRVIPAFGGEYALTPMTLLQQTPSDQTFGVLDGMYRVGGRGNSPESTITVDTVTYIVGQNCFRTDIQDYFAFALEP